jgi:hypothetical protein
MAAQHWKVSDWKNARLEAYRLLVKGVTIYRGGSEPIARDMQLGNLHDTYYEDAYGSLEPPQGLTRRRSFGRTAGGMQKNRRDLASVLTS